MDLKDIKLTPDDIKKFHAGDGKRFRRKLFFDIMEWYLPLGIVILAVIITIILMAS